MAEDAQDLVNKVMDGDDESSSDEEGAGSGVQLDGLRHLSVLDPTPLDESALAGAGAEGFERLIHAAATQAAEKLIHALWKLPIERTSQGPIATLPSQRGLAVLPREKPLPDPPKETRWEQFAREKGIEKKKRGRMVWDDVEQKWAPRHGYKRAYDEGEYPIHEVKAGEDPFEDPWDRMKAEKKQRVAKNEGQKKVNDERTGRRVAEIKAAMPVDLPDAGGGFYNGQGKAAGPGGAAPQAKRGKVGVAKTLNLVQNSTASMGAFDVRRAGETAQRKAGGTRKEKVSNDTTPAGLATEKSRNTKLLGRVLAEAEKPGKPKFKGSRGERIEARKVSREYHPLDDAPFENLGGGDAGDFKKKKGRAAAGKSKKITKKRSK